MSWKTIALSLAAATAACGGSSDTSGGASTADVQTFHTTSEAVAAAAESYGAAGASMPDVQTCGANESRYDAQVRPMVEQMRALAGGMDHEMMSMGQAGRADILCAADAMAAELDHHRSVACASLADMAPNRAEASHHAQAMTAWADHQRVRSEQMGSMMGMGGMGPGGQTGTCQRNADGSFTLGGGSAMPGPGGGGMMP